MVVVSKGIKSTKNVPFYILNINDLFTLGSKNYKEYLLILK